MLDVSKEESMLWVKLVRSRDFNMYHLVKSFFSCSTCFLFKSWMLSISFFRDFSSAPIGFDCSFRLKMSFYSFYCSGSYLSFPSTKLFTAFSLFMFYKRSFFCWIWFLISFITLPSYLPLAIFYPNRATFFSIASCLLYDLLNC
jgi:hypothetical protein